MQDLAVCNLVYASSHDLRYDSNLKKQFGYEAFYRIGKVHLGVKSQQVDHDLLQVNKGVIQKSASNSVFFVYVRREFVAEQELEQFWAAFN